jgi:hypothetical protein
VTPRKLADSTRFSEELAVPIYMVEMEGQKDTPKSLNLYIKINGFTFQMVGILTFTAMEISEIQ